MPRTKIVNVHTLENGDKLIKYDDGSTDIVPASEVNTTDPDGGSLLSRRYELQYGEIVQVDTFDNGRNVYKVVKARTESNDDTNKEESASKKWWQNGDAAKAEAARQSWNQWMPQGSTDYTRADAWQQIANTPDGSKVLKTKALGGNFPWQNPIFKSNIGGAPLLNILSLSTALGIKNSGNNDYYNIRRNNDNTDDNEGGLSQDGAEKLLSDIQNMTEYMMALQSGKRIILRQVFRISGVSNVYDRSTVLNEGKDGSPTMYITQEG